MSTSGAEFKITDPQVEVNNSSVAIKANSLTFTEGEGETTVEIAPVGNGQYTVVISDNAENKKGMCKFELHATKSNIDKARGWKKNPGQNVIALSGKTLDNKIFSRTFNYMTLTNDYEVGLQTDGSLSIEWEGAQPL